MTSWWLVFCDDTITVLSRRRVCGLVMPMSSQCHHIVAVLSRRRVCCLAVPYGKSSALTAEVQRAFACARERESTWMILWIAF